jgi:hypothetical protein
LDVGSCVDVVVVRVLGWTEVGDAIRPASSSLGACVSAENEALVSAASSSAGAGADFVVYFTSIFAHILGQRIGHLHLLIERRKFLGPNVHRFSIVH